MKINHFLLVLGLLYINSSDFYINPFFSGSFSDGSIENPFKNLSNEIIPRQSNQDCRFIIENNIEIYENLEFIHMENSIMIEFFFILCNL